MHVHVTPSALSYVQAWKEVRTVNTTSHPTHVDSLSVSGSLALCIYLGLAG